MKPTPVKCPRCGVNMAVARVRGALIGLECPECGYFHPREADE